MNQNELKELHTMCRNMRADCLTMAKAAGKQGFHFGAALSLIEIIAVLYTKVVKIDFNNPMWEERDRVILSKGHGVPAYYATLHQLKIISDETLDTFKTDNTTLYGHPSINQELGIEVATGSLGQGLSLGVGMALALVSKKNASSRVFVILGDGECNEGSVWEAAMSAAKYQLKNITVIIDCNGLQYDGETSKVMPLDELETKWSSFGWSVNKIDGHDVEACYEALKDGLDKPQVIIANTIKGKGISFMENNYTWHHGIMTGVQEEQAWKEVMRDAD